MCYKIERLTRRTQTRQLHDTQMPKIPAEETRVRRGAVETESAFGRWLHGMVRSAKLQKQHPTQEREKA